VLYELLTGVVPFDGETAVTIALKQVSATPPPPSALVGAEAIPAELDAVVLRALAKDPAERFADAEEFIAALEHVRLVLSGGGGRVPPVSVAGNGPVAPTSAAVALLLPLAEDRPPGGSVEDAAARRRWWWIGGAALLALVAAGVALALLLPAAKHRVTVPDVIRRTEALAIEALRAQGLTPAPTPAASTDVGVGLVISQGPAAGTEVQRGARVNLVVSSGPGTAGVPEVKGLTSAQAERKLTQAGFKPTAQNRSSTSVPAGTVIDTEPSQGVAVVAGSPVTVFVSTGPPQVDVPEVTGQSEAEARATLRAAGLHAGAVTKREEPGQTPGTVLSQSPAEGVPVHSGEAVNLVVAKAPQEVTVPRVVGKKKERAEGELIGAGFAAKSVVHAVSSEAEVGLVLQQSPAGGTKAKSGATVTITVGVLGQQTTPSTTTTTPPAPGTATTPPSAAPPAGAGAAP
jgi:beta-lactam-binding protein with PASTA domain